MRELRNRDPHIFRHITVRTVESRLWLTPNSTVRKLIGGVVARYQEIYKIEIYAYNFLGNHYHLLIKAPHSNTDEFCENVNREISRRINYLYKRQGPLWSRRYVDQQVVTDEDLLECFLYITTNACNHGLVQDQRDWGGLHSAQHAIDEKDRKFSFYHYSNNDEPITTHKLKLFPLPHYMRISKNTRKKIISKLINDRIKQISNERKAKFLGKQEVKNQDPGTKPRKSKKSKKGQFYCKCYEKILEMKKAYKEIRRQYDDASFHYRLGQVGIAFPINTFLPPLHRTPRCKPFCPLPA